MRSPAPLDISVLIATRNREHSLERLLDVLGRQDVDGLSYEVIVVDNGSTDGTGALLRRQAGPLPLVGLRELRPGKNRALNRAMEIARGRLIVFTDDDTIPVRGWLKEYHEAARRHPEQSIFAGPIEPLFPPGAPAILTDPAYQHSGMAFSRYQPGDIEGETEQVPMGPNYAVRAELLRRHPLSESIGPRGSHYPMGSETESLLRLRALGERFIFLPSARVGHQIEPKQLTLEWLRGRGFRYGWGHARLSPDTESPRLFGVPRHLWRRLIRDWFADRWYSALRHPARWVTAVNYQVARGIIHEYRLQSSASAAGTGPKALVDMIFSRRAGT